MIYFHALHEDVTATVINCSASTNTSLGRERPEGGMGDCRGNSQFCKQEYGMLGKWVMTMI